VGAAALWSLGVLVAALIAPVYSSVGSSSSGAFSQSHSTLAEENGLWVLLPMATPLLVTLILAALLHARQKRGQSGAGTFGWLITGLLGAFALISLASVGVFVVPVAVALVVACAASTRPITDLGPAGVGTFTADR
jgi:hypothetical protein